MHLMIMGFEHMTSGNKCKVKEDLVNQLIALNNKLNTLSPTLLHSEQARAEVQARRESPLRRNQAAQGERTPRQTLSCRPARALQFKYQVRSFNSR
jgi:hypothetical protein